MDINGSVANAKSGEILEVTRLVDSPNSLDGGRLDFREIAIADDFGRPAGLAHWSPCSSLGLRHQHPTRSDVVRVVVLAETIDLAEAILAVERNTVFRGGLEGSQLPGGDMRRDPNKAVFGIRRRGAHDGHFAGPYRDGAERFGQLLCEVAEHCGSFFDFLVPSRGSLSGRDQGK